MPKMSWTKKALLFATLIKKPFLAQLNFGGGPIKARSGLVEVTWYTVGYNITTISLQDRPLLYN